MSTRKQQNTLQLTTIKKFAVQRFRMLSSINEMKRAQFERSHCETCPGKVYHSYAFDSSIFHRKPERWGTADYTHPQIVFFINPQFGTQVRKCLQFE